MRIFLAISPSGNNSVPNSNTWLHNLYEPLLDIKYDVFLLRIDLLEKELNIPRNSKEFKPVFSQRLFDIFEREHNKKPFNYFISYFENTDVDGMCITNIKNKGVLTLNFSCNNIHQFYLVNKISPFYDYCLHSEKNAREKFLSVDAKPIWFQMAANPKYYRPLNIEKTIDVSFVGGLYAKRLRYIFHLLENNIDVQVFGPGWKISDNSSLRKIKREFRRIITLAKSILIHSPQKRAFLISRIFSSDFNEYVIRKYISHFNFPISDERMIEIYSQSKINLGFLEVFKNHDESSITLQHLHLREFEIPMSGGLYFTNYSEELAEHYEPDREVVVFRNELELLDKISYFLTHPFEAEKIRYAGLRRALSCHTYQKRFKNLFKKLNNV